MDWSSIVHDAANGEPEEALGGNGASRIEPTFSEVTVATLPVAEPANGARRTVRANAFLFRSGDVRDHVFRVESGALCLYENRRSDRPTVIEFLFPGDYVGLGFLEKHHLSARAMLDATVTCLPLDAVAGIVRDNPKAKAQLQAAIEREFEARRDELHSSGRRKPIERVAALLVTSARTNLHQGRRADLIEDSWRCGVIADLLQLTLDDLTAILLELERRGLITAAADGLQLLDITALEALADGMGPAIEMGGAHVPARAPRAPKRLANYRAA